MVVFCTFYPYLPGQFDGLAVPLSMMAQVVGLLGVAVVAVNLPWLVHEARRLAAGQGHRRIQARGYYYALASVIARSVVAVGASLTGSLNGLAFGLVALAPWGWGVSRFVPALQHVMFSHAAWNLTRSPAGLAERHGWYAVHDASRPHWKYVWFD